MELIELRTAHSKTYDLGNGLRKVIAQKGLHYLDRDTGGYEETPSEVAEDTYVPGFDYRFKGQHWSRFGKGKYKVGLAQGKSITYTFADVSPYADGATVMYENAWTQTDLRLLCFPEGVKEDIILKDNTAPTSFTFGYVAEGVTLTLADNSIDISGVGRIPAPYAVDANGARSEAVLSLNENEITITLDAEWLAGAIYPIVCDPTTIQPDPTEGKDTYTVDGSITSGTSDTLHVGRNGSAQIERGLIQFPLTTLTAGQGIGAAIISLYCSAEHDATDRDISACGITASWLEGSGSEPTDDATVLDTTTITGTNAWFEFDISSLAVEWWDGSTTNNGIKLIGKEDEVSSKYFYSSDYTDDAAKRPKLVVTQTAAPTVSITTMKGTQAAPTASSDDVTPTLSGVYTSSDSVAMAHKEVEVYDELGNAIYDTGKVAAVAATGVTVSTVVPLGYLRYGRKYKWRWKAYDANSGYSDWSSYGWFKPALTTTAAATDLAGADHLIAITPTGRPVVLEEGTDNLGAAYSWSAIYPIAKAVRILSTEQVLAKIRLMLYLPTGSALNVYYSNRSKDEGDGADWSSAKAVATGTTVQDNVTIDFPLASLPASSRFHRIKFAGTGPCEIYVAELEFTTNEAVR